MGATNLHPIPAFMIRSMLVKRIVRLGTKFVCGICRKHHKDADHANSCLNNCWYTVKTHSPIMQVRKLNKIYFACIYCLRSYPHPHHANECASDCTQSMGITEYDIDGVGSGRGKRDWMRAQQPQTEAPPVPAQAAAASLPTDVAPPAPAVVAKVVNVDATPPPAPAAASPAAAPEAAAAEPKYRKAGRTKKFQRAGAKYVCEVCQEKYFTKSEVEKCFDGHPD